MSVNDINYKIIKKEIEIIKLQQETIMDGNAEILNQMKLLHDIINEIRDGGQQTKAQSKQQHYHDNGDRHSAQHQKEISVGNHHCIQASENALISDANKEELQEKDSLHGMYFTMIYV